MTRRSRRLLINALGFVALGAMPCQFTEAANPFRFFRELFENTAKHADDAAKHIDDVLIQPRRENGIVDGAARAVRVASRTQRDEKKQDQDSWGYQEWCGIAGGICLLTAAYLLLSPKPHSPRKDS